MEPMQAEWLAAGVAQSAMQGKYGTDIDRESAYEVLSDRIQAGVEAAQRAADEKARAEQEAEQAEADAKARAQEDRERAADERERSTTRRTSSRSAPKSGVEKVLGSPTFWNQVIRVGSEVVRGMMGNAKRG
jgi:membrane protein involved in colicin uptake